MKTKRISALGLCIAMIMGIFVGCSKDAPVSEEVNTTKNTTTVTSVTVNNEGTRLTTTMSTKIAEEEDEEEIIFENDPEIIFDDVNEDTQPQSITISAENFDKCLFKHGLLCVLDQYTNKYGYINNKGQLEIDTVYDVARNFAPNGLAVVGVGEFKEKKYGYINTNGNYVITPQFDLAADFNNDGIAAVVVKADDGTYKRGYIDTEGNYIIEPQFDTFLISPIRDNDLSYYNLVENDLTPVSITMGNYGYIDQKGNYVIEPQFDSAYYFNSDGLAIVLVETEDHNEKFGMINKAGDFVIQPKFDRLYEFSSDGLAIAGEYFEYYNQYGRTDIKCQYGVIDKTGNYVIQPEYDEIEHSLAYGLVIAGIDKNGTFTKYGLLNKKGEKVTELIYRYIGQFSDNGLALVGIEINNELCYGYIDKSGKYAIEPIYEKATRFNNGLAVAKLNGKLGYINEKGEFLFNPKFGYLGEMSEFGLAPASDYEWPTGYQGFVNINGEYVIEPVFEDLYPFYDDGYTIGYWEDRVNSTIYNVYYEFSLINCDGEIISLGTLRPCKWRSWDSFF